MKINFIDLAAQQFQIRDNIDANIKKVLDHGQYIMGPEVSELEEKLADFVGVKYCIAVSSGTDALLIALMALGVGQGDEVITTPFSFIATAEMITLLGATPVFVDIDDKTYNIDTSNIETAITDKTRVIMPVSLYGQCADMDAINLVASKYNLPVIEDGAQSFGATQNERPSCGLSTIGCTSFFPSKPLGGYGDSGACFTDDDSLAKAMSEIRIHGQEMRYHHTRIGINGRMDTIQAAILLAKLDLFADEINLRQKLGQRYSEKLNGIVGLTPPFIAENNTSVYAQYTVRTENRDNLQEKLNQAGIPTAVHYPAALFEQPCLLQMGIELPITKSITTEVLSIPLHPNLDEETQDFIINTIRVSLK